MIAQLDNLSPRMIPKISKDHPVVKLESLPLFIQESWCRLLNVDDTVLDYKNNIIRKVTKRMYRNPKENYKTLEIGIDGKNWFCSPSGRGIDESRILWPTELHYFNKFLSSAINNHEAESLFCQKAKQDFIESYMFLLKNKFAFKDELDEFREAINYINSINQIEDILE